MLTVVNGDLLASDCSVIAHQSNCQGVMGSGIALQIRKQFPLAYKAFQDDKREPKEKLGSYSFALETRHKMIVFNLYGQLHFGRFNVCYTDYAALRNAISKMIVKVKEIEITCETPELKIGLPYGIGCGLAGGDWNAVMPIIKSLSELHEKELFLYKL